MQLFDADLRPLAVAERPAQRFSVRRPARPPQRRAFHGDTLLAVDGDSLAHRAFHAYAAREGPEYGFLALLAAICDQASFTRIVVGFDSRGDSIRRRRWPGYKANRPPKPPALSSFLGSLPGLLSDLGVRVVVADGWEADDVLGSAAAAAARRGWASVLVTSDRDAYALVDRRTSVLLLRSGGNGAVSVTDRSLRRSLGIAPSQYTEFAALRGDVSDNLAGIPGVGRVRAAALLNAYRCVADACADAIGCRSVLGPVPGQALLDDMRDPEASLFLRNVSLMHIQRDLPIDLDACRRAVGAEQIAERLASLRLSRLAGRVAIALAARPEDVPSPDPPVL